MWWNFEKAENKKTKGEEDYTHFDEIFVYGWRVVINMQSKIFTIGYSGFAIEDFINVLNSHNISYVADVRSEPYSQYFPQYNSNILVNLLNASYIQYHNYINEFGARQTDRKYQSDSTFLDFELFAKSEIFSSGMEKLLAEISKGTNIVLMCAEKYPINCHRAIMVSRAFFNAGYDIEHLIPNSPPISQSELELELLEIYFPNRNQLSLLEKDKNTSEYINEAYRLQNAKIGFGH